jgi:hypothetical protein
MIRAGFDPLRKCGLRADSHGTFFIQTRRSMRKVVCNRVTPNKQLQWTVMRHRGRGASAPFHCALAPRWTAPRAAAGLRRLARRQPKMCQIQAGEIKSAERR